MWMTAANDFVFFLLLSLRRCNATRTQEAVGWLFYSCSAVVLPLTQDSVRDISVSPYYIATGNVRARLVFSLCGMPRRVFLDVSLFLAGVEVIHAKRRNNQVVACSSSYHRLEEDS
ncbi:unnamed protein product, partial [Ectocarpus fasciculatus]